MIKGENNPFYGKKHTVKVRKILSNNAKKRVGEKNPFYGKKHDYITRKIISTKAQERFKCTVGIIQRNLEEK